MILPLEQPPISSDCIFFCFPSPCFNALPSLPRLDPHRRKLIRRAPITPPPSPPRSPPRPALPPFRKEAHTSGVEDLKFANENGSGGYGSSDGDRDRGRGTCGGRRGRVWAGPRDRGWGWGWICLRVRARVDRVGRSNREDVPGNWRWFGADDAFIALIPLRRVLICRAVAACDAIWIASPSVHVAVLAAAGVVAIGAVTDEDDPLIKACNTLELACEIDFVPT